MALEFYTDNGILSQEQFQVLGVPTRVYFIISQQESPELSCEVQFANESGLTETETLICPYASKVGYEHYYSSTYKPFIFHNLSGQESGESEDTPEILEPTPTPSPSVTIPPTYATVSFFRANQFWLLEDGFTAVHENPYEFTINSENVKRMYIGVTTGSYHDWITIHHKNDEEVKLEDPISNGDKLVAKVHPENLEIGHSEATLAIYFEPEDGAVVDTEGTGMTPVGDNFPNIYSRYTSFMVKVTKQSFCVPKDSIVTFTGEIGNNKYILNGGDTYGTFMMNVGKYHLTIPQIHPFYLVEDFETTGGFIEIEGEHGDSDGYWGDVTITVYEDFGTVSYGCKNHGAMGGTENLVFDSECAEGHPLPTPTALPTPTPEIPTSPTYSLEITEITSEDVSFKFKVVDDFGINLSTHPRQASGHGFQPEVFLLIDEVDHGSEIGYYETTSVWRHGVEGGNAFSILPASDCAYIFDYNYDTSTFSDIWYDSSFETNEEISFSLATGIKIHDGGDSCINFFETLKSNTNYFVKIVVVDFYSIGPQFVETNTISMNIPSSISHDFDDLTSSFESLSVDSRTSVNFTGTIKSINLEGGFIGIQSTNNDQTENYYPINLQTELQDLLGREIVVTSAYTNSDLVTTSMWGEYVYISEYSIKQEVVCFDEFGDTEIDIYSTTETAYLNRVSVNSDVIGKLRFNQTSGIALPQVYIVQLGESNNTLSLKITITAESFNPVFMFETNSGVVFKGSLTNNGTTVFNEYNCDRLFSVESVELRDVYSSSQPLYEGLNTDPLPGDYFSSLVLNNFTINEESSFYDSVFPQSGPSGPVGEYASSGPIGGEYASSGPIEGEYDQYGPRGPIGGYASMSYGFIIHKKNITLSDDDIEGAHEDLYDGVNSLNYIMGTPTIGELNENIVLETLTDTNESTDYIKNVNGANYAGIVYPRNTAFLSGGRTKDLKQDIGEVDALIFNELVDGEDLDATIFIVSESTNGDYSVLYRQSFPINKISGSITSSINELDIDIDLDSENTTNESSVTIKSTNVGPSGTWTLYYDEVNDPSVPVTYMVSLRTSDTDDDYENGGLKITLTSEVVRPRIELEQGNTLYVGYLTKELGTGINYLDLQVGIQ